ncbi:YjbQ family protein [[Eubacterium] cellulosolvens]
MTVFTKEFKLKTDRKRQVIEITNRLIEFVSESGISNGILFGSARHTTAILTTGVKREEPVIANLIDSVDILDKTRVNYLVSKGFEPNIVRSHVLGVILGEGLQIPIREGKLNLGEWQTAYLLELLGPAEREISITIIGD